MKTRINTGGEHDFIYNEEQPDQEEIDRFKKIIDIGYKEYYDRQNSEYSQYPKFNPSYKPIHNKQRKPIKTQYKENDDVAVWILIILFFLMVGFIIWGILQ